MRRPEVGLRTVDGAFGRAVRGKSEKKFDLEWSSGRARNRYAYRCGRVDVQFEERVEEGRRARQLEDGQNVV